MASIKIFTNSPDVTAEDINSLIQSFCDNGTINPDEIENVTVSTPVNREELPVEEKKELKPAFTYEGINFYSSNGDPVVVDPVVYNAVNNINANLIDTIVTKDALSIFDASTMRKAIDSSTMMALSNFILTVHNRYSVMLGRLNYLFTDPETNESPITFTSNSVILSKLDFNIPVMKYMNLSDEDRIVALKEGSLVNCIIAATNQFAYEVFNDVRKQMNNYLENIIIESDIIKDFYETLNGEIGTMMTDIVFETSLLMSNLNSVDDFIYLNKSIPANPCNIIEF